MTGSKHGVYDDLPWIEPLKEFLRAARAARVPQIGICFGHQIMAEAFGGRAEKSERGWGCGVHRYTTLGRAGWCRQAPESFTMHAMHQDQVTALPDDATVLATSDFCPYAMVAYGDPEEPHAISIQPHPEFDATFAAALLERRSGVAVPEELATRALATVHDPVDGTAFARWSLDYVRQSLAARRAA
ncbi:MAG: type 1 glutamine amidotransferase [Pseudomonadota bacterium]